MLKPVPQSSSNLFVLAGSIDHNVYTSFHYWINSREMEPKTVLQLVINSDGGDVHITFAILNLMRKSKHSVVTIANGKLSSAATLLFISWDVRYMYKNCLMMTHQISSVMGGYSRNHTRIKINTINTERLIAQSVELYRKKSKMSVERIKANFFTSDEAYRSTRQLKDMWIVDHIL